MSCDDEYRKRAAEAQGWADRTINSVDKEAWLRIAQSWLALIRDPRPTEQEAFEAEVQAQGTGQDASNKSN
jgi:hypothetical protein